MSYLHTSLLISFSTVFQGQVNMACLYFVIQTLFNSAEKISLPPELLQNLFHATLCSVFQNEKQLNI